MPCFEQPEPDVTIDDLIASSNNCISNYCSKKKIVQHTAGGFGSGIGAMFGLSGLSGCGPPGEDASSLLSFAKQYGQNLQTQNTMNFATSQTQIDSKFLTDLMKHNVDMNYKFQSLDYLIEANSDLEKIEIFGSYILIFLILFYILIN
jgi:hypothetical protein